MADEEETEQLQSTVGAVECPNWIADKLGIAIKDVASLEITSAASSVYSTLIEFLALTSVDATQPPPKIVNACADEPETSGRLSTLWTGLGSGCKPKLSVDNPSEAKYYLGLGNARASADGKDVFITHISRGNPIEVNAQNRLFRAVVLYAASPMSLKTLVNNALKWEHEIQKKNQMARDGKYVLYTLKVIGGELVHWVSHGQKDARPMSTVFLKEGLKRAILNDVASFMHTNTRTCSQNVHQNGGRENSGLKVVLCRSYLFHGPPGVGKTSLIRGIAGELKLNTCFLCLADKKIGNSQLHDALEKIPKPSMVILEDIDVLFDKERKKLSDASLTFSGLLNALDGLVSADDILTVMTTNHIERLDPALIRAGRVDRRFEFSTPEIDQVKELFVSFYPDAEKSMAVKFADLVFKREEKAARSIATLQQHFVYTRGKTAEKSLELLPEFFKEFCSGNLEDAIDTLYV